MDALQCPVFPADGEGLSGVHLDQDHLKTHTSYQSPGQRGSVMRSRCVMRVYLLRGVSINHVVHHGNLAVQQRRELQHLVRHHHGDVHSWSLPLQSRCEDTQHIWFSIQTKTHCTHTQNSPFTQTYKTVMVRLRLQDEVMMKSLRFICRCNLYKN